VFKVKIVNIEKLDGHKVIVITGRDENVRVIAKHIQAKLYYAPKQTDYFEDYPLVVQELKKTIDGIRHLDGVIAITSQSEEFLDCLLQSDLDFALVRVRKDTKTENLYRLSVMSKEEAWENRCAFNFNLRA
jgi:hypothetical protein